jgi:hypothetical protein
MKKDRWVWQPHPGHFICSRWCRFKLNTYVGGYLVSTVGEMWLERGSREIHAKIYDPAWYAENVHRKGDDFDHEYMKKFGYEEIGCGRKYETMVFKARKSGHQCCPYEADVTHDVDMQGYNDAAAAAKGHLALCEKWSKRVKKSKDV